MTGPRADLVGGGGNRARRLVWGLVLFLALVHWDFWYWDDRSLVFGFMPIGLAYQALFSVACGVVWALAVRFAWPTELEAWADERPPAPETGPADAQADVPAREETP